MGFWILRLYDSIDNLLLFDCVFVWVLFIVYAFGLFCDCCFWFVVAGCLGVCVSVWIFVCWLIVLITFGFFYYLILFIWNVFDWCGFR